MSKIYVKGATRMYNDKQLKYWIEAEENLGLKDSIYFWDNGTITQWVNDDEYEEYFKKIKGMDLNKVMDDYVEALEKKDWVRFFECMSILNEIETQIGITDDSILRRLMRLRKSTHEEFYKLK